MEHNNKVLTTKEAAQMLLRCPQTLRRWSIYGGPIAPVKIYGRLGWKESDVRRLLSGQDEKTPEPPTSKNEDPAAQNYIDACDDMVAAFINFAETMSLLMAYEKRNSIPVSKRVPRPHGFYHYTVLKFGKDLKKNGFDAKPIFDSFASQSQPAHDAPG